MFYRYKRDLLTRIDIFLLKCRKVTWAFSHTWVSNTLFKSLHSAEALRLVLARSTTWSWPILQAVLVEDTSISVWRLQWRRAAEYFHHRGKHTEKIKCIQSDFSLFDTQVKTKRAVKLVPDFLDLFWNTFFSRFSSGLAWLHQVGSKMTLERV